MAKQARLTLGLDIKPLQDAVKGAQKSLEEIGKVKLDRNVKKAFDKALINDAISMQKIYKTHLVDIKSQLTQMAKAGEKAWDPDRARELLGVVTKLKDGMKETSRVARSIRFGGGGTGGGGAGGGAGRGRGMLGGMGRMLGAVGVGFGVNAAINRAVEQAKLGMDVRGITGGAAVNDASRFGFTRMERRQRGMELGQAAGRDLSDRELNRRTNVGEMIQRGTGIQGPEFGQAMGAARRGGIEGQLDFVTGAIGDAVASGLSGSAIGEYLAAMTSYMESISKGVDINKSSLRGFSGALGEMDFFKKDPGRIFDAIQGIQSAFNERDPYQDFITYRALQEASGGKLTPAGVEIRRGMPLFGGIDKETREKLQELGQGKLLDVFNVSGRKAVEARIGLGGKDIKGMGQQEAFLAFSETMGLGGAKAGQAAPIYARYLQQQRDNPGQAFRLTGKEVSGLQKAGMSPEARAEKNMVSFDGSVVKFGKRIDDLKNVVSDKMVGGITKFVSGIDTFAEATGMFKSDIEKLLIVAAGGVGAQMMGGKLLGMAGGAVGGSLMAAGLPIIGAAAAGAAMGYGLIKVMDSFYPSWVKDLHDLFSDKPEQNRAARREAEIFESLGPQRISRVLEEKGLAPAKGDQIIGEMVRLEDKRSRDVQFNRELKRGMHTTQMGMQPARREVSDVQSFEDLAGEFAAAEDLTDGGFVQEKAGGGNVNLQQQAAASSIRSAFGMKRRKKPKPKPKKDGGMSLGERITKGLRSRFGKKKALGGPLGFDNVPVWATAGEYVVNAASTSKNMSALVYANSGGLIGPTGDVSAEPAMPSLNFIGMEMAMNANTSALRELTAVFLGSMSSSPGMRSFPTGDAGMVYGLG